MKIDINASNANLKTVYVEKRADGTKRYWIYYWYEKKYITREQAFKMVKQFESKFRNSNV